MNLFEKYTAHWVASRFSKIPSKPDSQSIKIGSFQKKNLNFAEETITLTLFHYFTMWINFSMLKKEYQKTLLGILRAN